MGKKTIDADAAKLAGLQIDTLQKVRSNQITIDQWERFNNLTSDEREARFGDIKNLRSVPSILDFIGTGTIPTCVRFVAREMFVVNTGNDAPVKISYLGDLFRKCFLTGAGKIEDSISEQTLQYHKLKKSSVDGPIIAELGGEAKVETSLSVVYDFMAKQANGEKGVLLNNGYANIFYVQDQNGVLRAVIVYWRSVGWHVDAYSVEDPRAWGADSQVFSRNSSAL